MSIIKTPKLIITKTFTWVCGDQSWFIQYVEIFMNRKDQNIIERIQLYGYELLDEVSEYEIDEQEDTDLVAEPLASALIEPGHRDSLQIVRDGDIGQTEGLLDALVDAGYISPPSWVGHRSVCKLLF
jgi:hypothetical protein